MARTGITYLEVADAATQLVGQGRNPTVEQVRLLLKTGSSTTIAKHLRQWKTNQESTHLISAKENLPTEFVAMMKGLWERVVDHSAEKVALVTNQYEQTVTELEQQLEKYKSNNQRWQKLYEQWLAEKNKFAIEKLTLEQALDFSHKEKNDLDAKVEANLQHIQEKNERINELHRLHKQTQDNLEHYRESVREQRLLDHEKQEQQKELLQSEINTLNSQLKIKQEKIFELQEKNNVLQHQLSTLNVQFEQLQSESANDKLQLINIEKEKFEYLHISQHWQNQFNELQKSFSEKTEIMLNVQTDVKLLSQQLMEAKTTITDLHNQNTQLNHEKWTLIQEKSVLEGQLKQMQKMITA